MEYIKISLVFFVLSFIFLRSVNYMEYNTFISHTSTFVFQFIIFGLTHEMC